MRLRTLAFVLTLVILPAPAFAQEETEREPPHPMEGEWTVDLRLSIEDAPYTQPMRLAFSDANSVTGEFYGSPIEVGRFGTAQGRECIAFRTSDNSGVYQHSACLTGAVLAGVSWSEGRDFVLPWTAAKD